MRYTLLSTLFFLCILTCFKAKSQDSSQYIIEKATKTKGFIGGSSINFIMVYLKRTGNLNDTIYIPEYGYSFSEDLIVFTTTKNKVDIFSNKHFKIIALPIDNPVTFMDVKNIELPSSEDFSPAGKEGSISDSIKFEKQLRPKLNSLGKWNKVSDKNLNVITTSYFQLTIPNNTRFNGQVALKIIYTFKENKELLFKVHYTTRENRRSDRLTWDKPGGSKTAYAAELFTNDFIKSLNQ